MAIDEKVLKAILKCLSNEGKEITQAEVWRQIKKYSKGTIGKYLMLLEARGLIEVRAVGSINLYKLKEGSNARKK